MVVYGTCVHPGTPFDLEGREICINLGVLVARSPQADGLDGERNE